MSAAAGGWRPDPGASFRWQDGERLIVYGPGRAAAAGELADHGYALLTTPRALAALPSLAESAVGVHEVGPGLVDQLAAELRGRIRARRLLALGGGRVIDTAKALAAADPPCTVMAIPTTLSGAEMTPVHRHAAGVAADTPRVRPAIVLNDPGLSATQPLAELADSAANALGHAVEGPLTPLGHPVATLAAQTAALELQAGLPPVAGGERGGSEGSAGSAGEPDRPALALGALLAGFVIGSTHYGLHHVLSQTLVRYAGLPHGRANAIMLPVSIEALRSRAPRPLAQLAEALGEDPRELAERFRDLGGRGGLHDAGVDGRMLERCAGEAAARPELALTPPAAEAGEIRQLYEQAL